MNHLTTKKHRVSSIENLAIYVPKGASTVVENPLQIGLIMQNKANVKMGKMNASVATIKDYEKKQQTTSNERYSKQTQTNPILESMNVNFCATGYYESKRAIHSREGQPIRLRLASLA